MSMVFPGQRLPRWENAPHVLQTQQFDRPFLDALFAFTNHLLEEHRRYDDLWVSHIGVRRQLLSLFYQPSSRTAASFIRAAQNLGMQTYEVREPLQFSSEVKGESFTDTVRTYAGGNDHAFRIADVIVLRHPEPERVFEAAEVSRVPVINAGNGADQHPTQSLVDLFAIQREVGRIDHLHVGFVGDLKHGRTCRSLAYLLAKVGRKPSADKKDDASADGAKHVAEERGTRFTFISHPNLRMQPDVCQYVRAHGVSVEERADYGDVLPTLDVLYVVRLQRERDPDRLAALAPELVPLRVTPESIAQLSRTARVLHPLPVDSSNPDVSEIHPELCAQARSKSFRTEPDPRLAWFRQADYGVPVRMALLTAVLQWW